MYLRNCRRVQVNPAKLEVLRTRTTIARSICQSSMQNLLGVSLEFGAEPSPVSEITRSPTRICRAGQKGVLKKRHKTIF